MGQLHELISVEPEIKEKMADAIDETKRIFSNRVTELLSGFDKRYQPLDDEVSNDLPNEVKHVVTTVGHRLDWTHQFIGRYIDAQLQKEATNQKAQAPIVIDGREITPPLPVSFLLNLEKQLKVMRDVYGAIPTLDTGLKWHLDSNLGQGIYRSEDETSYRTKKVPQSKVLYEATKEHPAQIEKWNEMVNIGKFTKVNYSGCMTTSDKAALLTRVSKLIEAVIKARQVANKTTVVDLHVAGTLLEFIFLSTGEVDI